LQLRVFGDDEDGNVWVGSFPGSEEVLMRAMAFGDAAYPRFGAQQRCGAGTGDYADGTDGAFTSNCGAATSYSDIIGQNFVWACLTAY
jgi:hypothetical protein